MTPSAKHKAMVRSCFYRRQLYMCSLGLEVLPYCFLLPELAVPNSALREIMAIKFEDLEVLNEVKVTEAWKRFFLNEDAVVLFLKTVSPEEVETVLAAGAAWRGTGWGTTRAAKAVRKLTGLAMVTTKFQEYLNSFLFSLSLCCRSGNPCAGAQR